MQRANRTRAWSSFLAAFLLGAITTLVLAGALALCLPSVPPARGPQTQLLGHRPNPPNWGWMVTPHGSLGHTCMVFRRVGRPADVGTPTAKPAAVLPPWSPMPDRGMMVSDHAFGLPYNFLYARERDPGDVADYFVISPRTPNSEGLRLPRRIYWPGLLMNTLTLGAAWWLLSAAVHGTRRSRRVRRGR